MSFMECYDKEYYSERNTVIIADAPSEEQALEFMDITQIEAKYTMGFSKEGVKRLREIGEISRLENCYVILILCEENTSYIAQVVNEVKAQNVEFAYYKLFYDSYNVKLSTLQSFRHKCFIDKNKNRIELKSNIHGSTVIKIENCRCTSICIGKNFCAGNLTIEMKGDGSKLIVDSNVFIHSGKMQCFDSGTISVGAETRIMRNVIIQCVSCGTIITPQDRRNYITKPCISIQKHVEILNDVVLLDGTCIENGSIIAPYSVVDSTIPSCTKAAGNRAGVIQTNISWAFDQLTDQDVECYDLQDRAAYRYFKRKTVFVHSSCVSRSTVEYSAALSVKYHLLQNPIHTMFYKGISISPDLIKVENQSNFLRKTLATEFEKSQIECIKNNVADFFLMDLADIRWSYFELKNKPDVRLYAHYDIYNTLVELRNESAEKSKEYEFEKREFNTIPIEEWKKYIDQYVDIILNYYSKRQIIFLRVPIAKSFYEDGKRVDYSKDILEIRMEPLLREIEDYLLNDKLRGVKVISLDEECYGDAGNELGNMPLHYLREVYIKLVKQIDDYVEQADK